MSNEPEKSQTPRSPGVVEYVLVTIFVAIIVIFVLTILGPGIGRTFSGPMNELSVPPIFAGLIQ